MPGKIGDECAPQREARNCQIFNSFKILKRSINNLSCLYDEINGEVITSDEKASEAPAPSMAELISSLPDLLRASSEDINKLIAEIKGVVL